MSERPGKPTHRIKSAFLASKSGELVVLRRNPESQWMANDFRRRVWFFGAQNWPRGIVYENVKYVCVWQMQESLDFLEGVQLRPCSLYRWWIIGSSRDGSGSCYFQCNLYELWVVYQNFHCAEQLCLQKWWNGCYLTWWMASTVKTVTWLVPRGSWRILPWKTPKRSLLATATTKKTVWKKGYLQGFLRRLGTTMQNN